MNETYPFNRTAARHAFEEYTKRFDAEDERIALKIFHTLCVSENCDKITCALSLSAADRDEAWLIGLLHDIGRFEQSTKNHSFLDSGSNDHAEEGVRYLFDEGHIADFLPKPETADETVLREICLAIKLHNKFELPEDLTERERLFCHVIRDADKLDIFRVSTVNAFAVVHEYHENEVARSPISPAVIECFEKHITLNYQLRKYPADIFLGHIAMCFGLHFSVSRQIAKAQGYVEKMMNFSFELPESQEQYTKLCLEAEAFLNAAPES